MCVNSKTLQSIGKRQYKTNPGESSSKKGISLFEVLFRRCTRSGLLLRPRLFRPLTVFLTLLPKKEKTSPGAEHKMLVLVVVVCLSRSLYFQLTSNPVGCPLCYNVHLKVILLRLRVSTSKLP